MFLVDANNIKQFSQNVTDFKDEFKEKFDAACV